MRTFLIITLLSVSAYSQARLDPAADSAPPPQNSIFQITAYDPRARGYRVFASLSTIRPWGVGFVLNPGDPLFWVTFQRPPVVFPWRGPLRLVKFRVGPTRRNRAITILMGRFHVKLPVIPSTRGIRIFVQAAISTEIQPRDPGKFICATNPRVFTIP